MVKLMLDGFGGDCRRQPASPAATNARAARGISCYHVNARLSRNLQDIGELGVMKAVLLFWYCLQAIWCRFRYGVTTLYYVPAPGKRVALMRDWLVMRLCRPFFKQVILHWHAAGLGKWLETVALGRTRAATYHLMQHVDLSIVLSRYNLLDAQKLLPRNIAVVSNGIPDPCPQFDRVVLPRRRARRVARRKLLAGQALDAAEMAQAGGDPQVLRVLYLAHCTREKGLFDAIAAVRLASQALAARGSLLRVKLFVAGGFLNDAERKEFDALLADAENRELIRYIGFVAGEAKDQALAQADLFCFPTYFGNENQPVNLIEALAYGLPILTTHWRSVSEIMPSDYPGLTEPQRPEQMARLIPELATADSTEALRDHFLRNYTIDCHLDRLAAAVRSVESAPPRSNPA